MYSELGVEHARTHARRIYRGLDG